MLVSTRRKRRKSDDSNKENKDMPPIVSKTGSDPEIVYTRSITEETIRDWREHFDDSVKIQAILPIDSLFTLANALGTVSCSVDRPLGTHSLSIQTLAHFDRWLDTMKELEQNMPRAYQHIPGQVSKANIGISMDFQTRQLVLKTSPDWSPNGESGDYFENNMRFEELYAFLFKAAHRADQCDFLAVSTTVPRTRRDSRTLQRKRTRCALNDQKAIRYEDIVHMTNIVKEILDKIANIAMWSLSAVVLMRRGKFTESEIASVYRRRTVDELVTDMYQRGEIPYGLHWLRDWFPVWAVQRWDPNWAKENVFGWNGKGVFSLRDGEGSAVKELRGLYRARYQKILERECKVPYGIHHYTWAKFNRSYYYYI